MIPGWECSLVKDTGFVERALRHAVAFRIREGHPLDEAIHHSDAGSQYTAIHYGETLMLEGLIRRSGPSATRSIMRCIGSPAGVSRRRRVRSSRPGYSVIVVSHSALFDGADGSAPSRCAGRSARRARQVPGRSGNDRRRGGRTTARPTLLLQPHFHWRGNWVNLNLRYKVSERIIGPPSPAFDETDVGADTDPSKRDGCLEAFVGEQWIRAVPPWITATSTERKAFFDNFLGARYVIDQGTRQEQTIVVSDKNKLLVQGTVPNLPDLTPP